MYQSQGTETGTLNAQNVTLQVHRLGAAIVAHDIHYVLQELCKFFLYIIGMYLRIVLCFLELRSGAAASPELGTSDTASVASFDDEDNVEATVSTSAPPAEALSWMASMKSTTVESESRTAEAALFVRPGTTPVWVLSATTPFASSPSIPAKKASEDDSVERPLETSAPDTYSLVELG
jgi:hypothetical protein